MRLKLAVSSVISLQVLGNMSSMEKKIYILIVFTLLLSLLLTAQCPERNLLWKRITFFRDSAAFSPPPARQLEELLKYERSITDCAYRFDTTHALLLQRIGALYLGLEDYAEALQYTLQSIAISDNNPSTKINGGSKVIIRSYFTLARIYGILNRARKRWPLWIVVLPFRSEQVGWMCIHCFA